MADSGWATAAISALSAIASAALTGWMNHLSNRQKIMADRGARIQENAFKVEAEERARQRAREDADEEDGPSKTFDF